METSTTGGGVTDEVPEIETKLSLGVAHLIHGTIEIPLYTVSCCSNGIVVLECHHLPLLANSLPLFENMPATDVFPARDGAP